MPLRGNRGSRQEEDRTDADCQHEQDDGASSECPMQSLPAPSSIDTRSLFGNTTLP